jgi:hypothetical protein
MTTMTTSAEQPRLSEAAGVPPALRALHGKPVRSAGSPPDAGAAGQVGASPLHSSPLTAAAIDRLRASDVAAPPRRALRGGSRPPLACAGGACGSR